VELDRVRTGLRDIVRFIERRKRLIVKTDFIDHIAEGSLIDLPGTLVGVDTERVREKAMAFLRQHQDDPVVHKLKFNEPLTSGDLAALESIFLAEGSTPEEVAAASSETNGLGLFVRSLVGLDREAAKQALSTFFEGKSLTANQMEFTDLIVNHLASRGWIEPQKLYDSPFTDLHPHGVEGIFNEQTTLTLLSALQAVKDNAVPRASPAL
jgi:type I restriction enzyme R subunit